MEVMDRKKRQKLTKRKKMDPCMEPQPLASADQADATTQAQCMAADGPHAGASAAHCTVAFAAGDAFQAGLVPSSAGAAQDHAPLQHTAADNSLQVQASSVLNHDHAGGLLVASVASPNRNPDHAEGLLVANVASPNRNPDHAEGLLVASVASPNRKLAWRVACMEDVVEVTGSQEGSLAAVPRSDDEAKVCTSG